MLPAIDNGFTFIAFLMFLAGGLLAMEKYTKWKVFNWVPPLVWIYILNMVFCTLGPVSYTHLDVYKRQVRNRASVV